MPFPSSSLRRQNQMQHHQQLQPAVATHSCNSHKRPLVQPPYVAVPARQQLQRTTTSTAAGASMLQSTDHQTPASDEDEERRHDSSHYSSKTDLKIRPGSQREKEKTSIGMTVMDNCHLLHAFGTHIQILGKAIITEALEIWEAVEKALQKDWSKTKNERNEPEKGKLLHWATRALLVDAAPLCLAVTQDKSIHNIRYHLVCVISSKLPQSRPLCDAALDSQPTMIHGFPS
ncbi:uncharacterized protein LOC129875677 [Solanum dulcamara]|uniref:uncharacterized protein LOC129875677 n=1 Tax=Solanum dulcamara TaxID=45834 RepID=UPI0024861650|nr:uncharacterized protein LOC129875677 [Solanum dulcamara]